MMENTNNFPAEELQKCPYHQMLAAQGNNSPDKENTGDWADLDQTDEEGTNPDRNENGGNDNSGGAGSSGSASTNS